MTEQRDGMRVIRTWVWPSKSSRMLPRLFCYLSFALSCLVLGHWGIGKQNLVMIETPPLFLPPFGLLIGKLKRARTVLMIADIWPDILVQMGHAREGPALRMMYRLERFCYEHANGVALTTPGMWSQVRERFPHLPNVTLISNGVDTGLFRPAARDLRVREELGAGPDQLLVGYCGLHGLAQGLEIVLDAAERLKDRHDIRFVMIGDGPTKEAVVQKARELNLPGVRLQDQRPKSDMPAIVASLDVSLMPLGVRIPGAMPSKVYEAMASGAVPVVAKGTDADRLLTEHQAGLSYEPGDLNGLVECIAQLAEDRNVLRNLRQNAIQLAQRFDRRVLAERSAAVLTAIAEGRPAPPVLW